MRVVLLIVALACLAAVAAGTRPRRRRPDARFARRRDVAALRAQRDAGDRVPLGQQAGPSWRPRRRPLAAPSRDSVLVLGPTGGGKTSSILIPAILAWQGPVLAVSVKDDLFDATAAWRRTAGPLQVLDPTGGHSGLAGRFDPVRGVCDRASARRVAASLCGSAAVGAGEAESRFWSQLAAKLLAPMLLAAHTSGGGIDEVTTWIDRRDESTPLDLLQAAGEHRSVDALLASLERDERQLSSVYATVESILEPLVEEATTTTPVLDVDRLLADNGTLYLCAPLREQRRFAAMFCAVIDEVVDRAIATARVHGGVLDPRLLVVLDEAAAIAPIADLDVLAATCGGQGISLVTCFQDLAQVKARWGERAGTVLNNHRTRVFVAGMADPELAGVLGGLTGTVLEGRDRERTLARRAIVEAAEIRELPPYSALVVSGGTPVARVRLVPWWAQRVVKVRGPSRASPRRWPRGGR